MTSQPTIIFSERPVVILDLPLAANTRLLHPDQVMLKIGNYVHDVGAFCYTLRSKKKRNLGRSRQVVLNSFRKERINQIRQLIKVFSCFLKDAGKRPATVINLLDYFKLFMDWADVNGCPDGLVGGDATKNAYRLFANDVEDRVPEYVCRNIADFRECPQCRRVYWPGTHGENARRFLRRHIPGHPP